LGGAEVNAFYAQGKRALPDNMAVMVHDFTHALPKVVNSLPCERIWPSNMGNCPQSWTAQPLIGWETASGAVDDEAFLVIPGAWIW